MCKAKFHRLKEAYVKSTKQKCFEKQKSPKTLGLGKMSWPLTT